MAIAGLDYPLAEWNARSQELRVDVGDMERVVWVSDTEIVAVRHPAT